MGWKLIAGATSLAWRSEITSNLQKQNYDLSLDLVFSVFLTSHFSVLLSI